MCLCLLGLAALQAVFHILQQTRWRHIQHLTQFVKGAQAGGFLAQLQLTDVIAGQLGLRTPKPLATFFCPIGFRGVLHQKHALILPSAPIKGAEVSGLVATLPSFYSHKFTAIVV